MSTNTDAGRKNMLATTWSKPRATKAMIGKKMAMILPPMSSAPNAIHTARHTSQLQPIARMKIWSRALRLPFSSAMAPSRSLVIAMSRSAALVGEEVGHQQRTDQVAEQREGEVERIAPDT